MQNTAKAPKQRFHILVGRYAVHQFAVDAGSHEEACRILERELDAGKLREAKGGKAVFGPFWADPADEDDAWAVTCDTRPPGEALAPLLAWNGKAANELPLGSALWKDLAKR